MTTNACFVHHIIDIAINKVENDDTHGIKGDYLGEECFASGIPIVDPFFPDHEKVDPFFEPGFICDVLSAFLFGEDIVDIGNVFVLFQVTATKCGIADSFARGETDEGEFVFGRFADVALKVRQRKRKSTRARL